MTPSSRNRTKVFVCYSHKDKKFLEGLLPHLESYAQSSPIDYWVDTKIKPGANWQKEIENALASASVAILLISIDFLISQFIVHNELPPLLAAAQSDGVTILPVILRPCILPKSLSQFQLINSPSVPLAKMKGYQREEIWVKVITALRENLDSQVSTSALSGEKLEERYKTKNAYKEELRKIQYNRDSAGDHQNYPFSVAFLEYTQLDVELYSSTGQFIGRPWSTFLLDSYSHRILAVYLSFDPPGYQACMMVLRICVRRYKRLPQIVVVDRSKEFQSAYFDTLLARYNCIKQTRSVTKSFSDLVVERLFRMTNTQFVQTLLDRLHLSKQSDHMTKSVRSGRQKRELEDMYELLCQWVYEVYDQTEHPVLGQSPRDAFLMGLTLANEQEHNRILYDEEFLIMTLPSTPKGIAMVQPAKGIKINSIFYWNGIFQDPTVERTKVPVRYDPLDAGVAYAFVQNRWIQCISQNFIWPRSHTEK